LSSLENEGNYKIGRMRSEMDEGTIRMAAQMWALIAEMNAVIARIEGMRAFNTGQLDGAGYEESAFLSEEGALLEIAKKLRSEI
jgi:hypothetical protein